MDYDLLTEKVMRYKSRGFHNTRINDVDWRDYVMSHIIKASVRYDASKTDWTMERHCFYYGCLAYAGYFRYLRDKKKQVPTVGLTYYTTPATYDNHERGVDINKVLKAALKKPIWRHIVRMYYIDQHKMPYIARYYGLTQQRIHQIIKYSIGKMQAYCRKNGIQFTDF